MKHAALALLATCLSTAPALAQPPKTTGCRMGLIAELPVTFEHNRPTVPVQINGKPVKALIDTGAASSMVFLSTARRLGLTVRDLPGVRVYGADGPTQALQAHVDHFSLMGASSGGFDIGVGGGGSDVDMLIGQDFLLPVDVELDLGRGKLRLMRPNHCADDEMAYWATQYSEARFQRPDGRHVQLTVKLNGSSVPAILDSGAAISMAAEDAAFRAGVSLPGAATGKVYGIGGQGLEKRVGLVKSVSVGDETVANAPLTFGRLYARNEASHSDSRIPDEETMKMLLGADFLKAHRVFIVNETGKVYFTYNGGPIFRTEAPTPEIKGAPETTKPAAPPALTGTPR